MSVYARTFVEQMEKPDVDLITGVPPTVAIEQRISRGGGKSTVATVTEVYHFLRLLFAKLGTQHCPKCQVPVKKQSVGSDFEDGVASTREQGAGAYAGAADQGAQRLPHRGGGERARHGIETLLVDGEFRDTMNFKRLERFKEHTIDAVIARTEKTATEITLRPLVEKALKLGKGTMKLRLADKSILVLNTEMSCASCGLSFEELDPRLFSFNSPHGWCKDCRGFGVVGRKLDLSDRQPDDVGAGGRDGRGAAFHSDDEEIVRETCPSCCGGSRINEIGARGAACRAARFRTSPRLSGRARGASTWAKFKFEGTEAIIARDIVKEIEQRLKFMQEVGLGYLQLNRSADTLSGGEAQRIRFVRAARQQSARRLVCAR